MLFSRVPGGWAMISMPLSRMSSAWTSSRCAWPPPKSVWKVYSKFFWICSNVTLELLLRGLVDLVDGLEQLGLGRW